MYMYSTWHTRIQMLGIVSHIQNLSLSKTITYVQQVLWQYANKTTFMNIYMHKYICLFLPIFLQGRQQN